jgi:hypothetical protein
LISTSGHQLRPNVDQVAIHLALLGLGRIS